MTPMTTDTKTMPPIKCTPCRVTYKQLSPSEIAGHRFHVQSNGVVTYLDGSGLKPEYHKLVRQEAARQRRNRNSRERQLPQSLPRDRSRNHL